MRSQKVKVVVENIGKDFNRRNIFKEISFVLESGESLAITGKNGAGKSTLVKILADILTPTRGSVQYYSDGSRLTEDDLKHTLGLVSPYLQLYDEFTAWENMEILSAVRANGELDELRLEETFRLFNLWHRKHDIVRTFSSGMKQRLKYVFALQHRPDILLLDEPTSNLDEEGIEAVKNVVKEYRSNGILVIATNDVQEAGWCDKKIYIGDL